MLSEGNDPERLLAAEINPPYAEVPTTCSKYSKGLIDQTIKVWQQYSDAQLTARDAEEIITNMVGLYQYCEFIASTIGAPVETAKVLDA